MPPIMEAGERAIVLLITQQIADRKKPTHNTNKEDGNADYFSLPGGRGASHQRDKKPPGVDPERPDNAWND
jgi:hypothetical protein